MAGRLTGRKVISLGGCMKRISKVLVMTLLAAACATPTTPTAPTAPKRERLFGYGPIQFGMTETDVLGLMSATSDKPKSDGSYWMSADRTEDVDGERFGLRILLDDGGVRRVALLGILASSHGSCDPVFRRFVDFVADRYGPPEPSSSTVQPGNTQTANFMFANGDQIAIRTDLAGSIPAKANVARGKDDVCAISIVHNASGWNFTL